MLAKSVLCAVHFSAGGGKAGKRRATKAPRISPGEAVDVLRAQCLRAKFRPQRVAAAEGFAQQEALIERLYAQYRDKGVERPNE